MLLTLTQFIKTDDDIVIDIDQYYLLMETVFVDIGDDPIHSVFRHSLMMSVSFDIHSIIDHLLTIRKVFVVIRFSIVSSSSDGIIDID